MHPFSRQPLSSSPTSVTNHDSPTDAVDAATRRLFLAIECAPTHDLLPLLKDAMASGAMLSKRDGLDRDVITFAVLKNRPDAIGLLLALGACMPEVPADGIDLLMRASTLDFASCCRVLIDTGGMDVDAVDAEGRSALHHAAQAGAMSAVRVLLNAGGDPDLGSRQMSAESLGEAFSMNSLGQGFEVVPLMLAAARADRSMISLMLEMGADPNKGDFPALHIAATQHDASMIAHLLDHGATIADSVDWATNSALLTAITTDAPLACLRLLARDYPFNTDDARDPDQVLQHAIHRGRVDAIALFLEHGAQPGDHTVGGEPSLWQLAVDCHTGNLTMQLALLDQLASQRADRWNASKPDVDRALFAFGCLASTAGDLASTASSGFFPSLVQALQPQLLATRGSQLLSRERQSVLHAAWHFLDMLNKLNERGASPLSVTYEPSVMLVPAPQGANNGLKVQTEWLREAATLLVTTSEDATRQLLMLPFFRQMANDCPDDVRLDRYIQSQLSDVSSLPDSFIHLISEAWFAAARDAVQWHGDRIDLTQSENLTWQRALMIVAYRTDSAIAAAQHPAIAAWTAGLHALATARLTLAEFAEDPVRWLMRKEQRHNLRPVDPANLTITLCCELGLPPDTSGQLADAWTDVIAKLATGDYGHLPSAWWRAAAQMLSPTIASMFVSPTLVPLPGAVRTAAEIWCVQQTGPLPGRVSVPIPTSSVKNGSINGEPPYKKARHE
jgi:ankyrin repeat protein